MPSRHGALRHVTTSGVTAARMTGEGGDQVPLADVQDKRRLPRRTSAAEPRRPEGPEPWPLSAEEIKAAGFYAAVLHYRVVAAADEFAGRGVSIDAEWSGDQATLACLVVMHALDFEIPWDGPIELFAADLQPPGSPRSRLTTDRSAHGGDHRRQPERHHRDAELDGIRRLRADRWRPGAVQARGTAGDRGASRFHKSSSAFGRRATLPSGWSFSRWVKAALTSASG